MADLTDPRPVLRQELARIFKNQRVIRAFEKIFDLIPPEFIDQQIQIDTVSFAADLANSQAVDAIAAIDRLTGAVDRLALAPTPIDTLPPDDVWPRPFPYSDLINLTSTPPIDQSIVPTWTGLHTFTNGVTTNQVLFSTAGATALSYYQEFDGTSTACTGALTVSVAWKATRIGRQVTVLLPATSGTASAAAFFEYGEALPAAFRPAASLTIPVFIRDNGLNVTTPGMMLVNTSGVMRVYKDSTAATNYTAAATAGLGQGIGTTVSWSV